MGRSIPVFKQFQAAGEIGKFFVVELVDVFKVAV
jgi:hypothetical protein